MRTKNVKFSAYLQLKNIHPVDVIKLGHGRAEYVYNISEEDWSKEQIDFNASDFLEYANSLEAIKNLAY